MESWMEMDGEELPYRNSIDPNTYKRCGFMYKHYFMALELMGPLETSEDLSSGTSDNVRVVKVGAKPLSGVRGIYYTRGTWRVQYRGRGQEVVSCVFSYDSKEVLIATFDLAFKLLRKVIKLGRQIKKEDGMIIGHLTEDRLLDLDRRSKRRTVKTNNLSTKDSTVVSHKRVSRPRHDYYNDDDGDDDDTDDDDSEFEGTYPVVNKKSRPASERSEGYSKSNSRNTMHTSPVDSPTAVIPNMQNYYGGKLSVFERQFQSYAHLTTRNLIGLLIDEANMENNERVTPGRQRGLYCTDETTNATQSDTLNSRSTDSYARGSPIRHHVNRQDSFGIGNSETQYDRMSDGHHLVDSNMEYSMQTAICTPQTSKLSCGVIASKAGLNNSCNLQRGYDNDHILQYSTTAEATPPSISPNMRPKALEPFKADANPNQDPREGFLSFYGYDAGYH